MRPDREPNHFPKPGSDGVAMDTDVMQEHLERSRFFLSVVSRAPEVTVFNTPRVSIWPTYWDEAPSRRGFKPEQFHTAFDG